MRTATRSLLSLAALVLAAGGGTHLLAFPGAARAVGGSNLPAFFAATFRALWLGDSATLFAQALAFGALAARPGLAARPLILVLALGPLANAVAIYITMGGFFAGHLLLLAGATALLAGALHRREECAVSGRE